MFNNAHTIVISHYCVLTETLPRLIHPGFRLPHLCRGCGEFAATTFGKDEVLPRASGPIVSSGAVVLLLVVRCKNWLFLSHCLISVQVKTKIILRNQNTTKN